MPNWVYTSINASGSKRDIKALVSRCSGKNGIQDLTTSNENDAVDFNNFIPMPSALLGVDVAFYPKDEMLTPEQRAEKVKQEAEQADLKRLHGFGNWYDWSIHHWGTKWNARGSNVEVDKDGKGCTIIFETAWGSAEPVFLAMSKAFPKVRFEVCAEEEAHFFHYEAEYKNGIQTHYQDIEHEEDEDE